MRLSFFSTPKHKVFNYQPRYYNPEAEDLKARIARALGEDKNENYIPGKNIRYNFRKHLHYGRKHPGMPVYRKFIFMITLLALALAVYHFAKSLGLFFS